MENVDLRPLPIEPYDKVWGVGVSGLTEDPSPFPRVNRLLKWTKHRDSTADSQRALIVTEGYRKYAHLPQNVKWGLILRDIFTNVSIRIWPDELIVGELAERVRRQTEKIYRDFELFGIARLDYLYDEAEDILYLNEINSQPGSLSYYLFEEIGIEFPDLLKRVIAEGRERSARKGIIAFNSGVLDNLSEFMRK